MVDATALYPRHADITRALKARNRALRLSGSLVVPTDVLLPNHSHCVVIIEGGVVGDRITVSDAGAALASVAETGLEITHAVLEAARRTAIPFGVGMEGGVLRTHPVSPEDAVNAVVALANAMREVARVAFDAARRAQRTRFRERVFGELNRIFTGSHVRRDGHIRGSSEDSLRFDYVVALNDSRRLVVDAPLPDLSSIASVVLKQSDLRVANIAGVKQAIVYDEDDRWPSSGLAQLNLAQVPVISAVILEQGLRAASQK